MNFKPPEEVFAQWCFTFAVWCYVGFELLEIFSSNWRYNHESNRTVSQLYYAVDIAFQYYDQIRREEGFNGTKEYWPCGNSAIQGTSNRGKGMWSASPPLLCDLVHGITPPGTSAYLYITKLPYLWWSCLSFRTIELKMSKLPITIFAWVWLPSTHIKYNINTTHKDNRCSLSVSVQTTPKT